MPVEAIYSFLVHPAKNADNPPEISGTQIPRFGSLYEMLISVFERAPRECNIEIIFRPDDNGRQRNECRDSLITYTENPNLENGKAVAGKLQEVTTHRSGLGLLFLIKGIIGREHCLVISRFPADQGIIAQEDDQNLSVEFIERIFMKNAKAYKSAIYISESLSGGFWDGMAIDRQISGYRELSDYWIREFLQSELRTTGQAGTKRLAVALRTAIRTFQGLSVRQELISTTRILRGRHGQTASARQIVEQLRLSQEAVEAVENAFPRPDLMNEVFQFDLDEFNKHVIYRSIELDNGGILIAEDNRFEEVFNRQELDKNEGRIRFITEGRIVDEILRKSR